MEPADLKSILVSGGVMAALFLFGGLIAGGGLH